MKIKFALFFSVCLFFQNLYGQIYYSKKSVLEDVNFLQKKLLKHHPNLFVYSSPRDYSNFIDSLNIHLPDSLNYNETYSIVSEMSSVVKDGHTHFLPSSSYMNNLFPEHLIFPFEVYWNNDSLMVLENYSVNQSIPKGSVVCEINGLKTRDVVNKMMNSLPRDGYNTTYPKWIINNFFSSYLNFSVGEITSIKLTNGSSTYVVNGSTYDSISKLRKTNLNCNQNLLSLDIDTSLSLAILKINTWHKSTYKENGLKFKKFIGESFEDLDENKVQHLVLDFRDNQGGSLSYGKTLLAQLFTHNFRMVDKYYRVKKRNYENPNARIRISYKDIGMTRRNTRKSFNGSVFVLVNGGSFSNTGMVSACLKKNNRAVFIGEETGGSQKILSSDYKQFSLPHSKIRVDIPTLQYLLPAFQENSFGGVMPDYLIVPTYADLIDKKDLHHDKVLNLIEANKSK